VGCTWRTRQGAAIARGHGEQRQTLGYDLGGVIREYGALRDVVLDLARQGGVEPTVRDLEIFARLMIAAVAEAAEQYSLGRDRQLREQAGRHVGFLAHELRNPISAALLTLDLAERRGDLEGLWATRVRSALKRAAARLDEALLSVRQQAPKATPPQTVDFSALVAEAVDEVRDPAELRSISLELQAQPGILLQGQPKVLFSAVSNLVENAVKFTREGGRVALRLKADEDRVVFEVEDECGGLPDGDLQKLFDPFVQVGTNRSGAGLGLAITRQAAEAHAGSIRVHNLPGKGCVFMLDLPVVAPILQTGMGSSD
jgi:signal transduction histidine kinase